MRARLHNVDTDTATEVAALHQSEWCSALNDGIPCGGTTESDPQVRVFCDEECAEEFARRLREREPAATLIANGKAF